MTLHRIITIAGTVAALTLTVAPAASAATGYGKRCVAPPTANVDHGAAVMKVTANLKRGPYQGPRCATITKLAKGTTLYFQCWTTNEYGNRWVYARVKGTRTNGWMSIDNIKLAGGDIFLKNCPTARAMPHGRG
ncbi:hypothetical protein [Nonomuraea endophytica]|uniref:SH3 domain-containing protein n=1 Tax=Nonomuraea endophytica TaxID=714136 RepID=A0A7W7ZXR7_9ACTN|nr:hypothetical protein [Nonomuraea endophytica]MBB5075787.1 hypothetical protein [Nonomuraea endophytica]